MTQTCQNDTKFTNKYTKLTTNTPNSLQMNQIYLKIEQICPYILYLLDKRTKYHTTPSHHNQKTIHKVR